jgi:hypothetical protein
MWFDLAVWGRTEKGRALREKDWAILNFASRHRFAPGFWHGPV